MNDREQGGDVGGMETKTRLGWNSVASCHEEVGDPTDAQAVQQKLSDELDRLAQRLKTGETGGSSKA